MEHSILATLPPEVRNLIYKELFGVESSAIDIVPLRPRRSPCGRLDFILETYGFEDYYLTMAMTSTLTCKQMRSESLGVFFGHAAILFCECVERFEAHELAKAAHDWLIGLGSTIHWLRFVGVEFYEECGHRLVLDKRGLTSLVADFLNLFFTNNIPCFALVHLFWHPKNCPTGDIRSISLLDSSTTFDEFDNKLATFVKSARDSRADGQPLYDKRETDRCVRALQKYLIKLQQAITTKRGAVYTSPVRLENMPDPSARQQDYHLGRQLCLKWKAALTEGWRVPWMPKSDDTAGPVDTAES